jgi:hypothetical protein
MWDPVLAAIALLAIMFWWKYFVWVFLAVLVLVAMVWRLPWQLFLYIWLREKQKSEKQVESLIETSGQH